MPRGAKRSMSIYSVEQLGARVVTKRRRLRLSQEKLGARIGIRAQHVSAIENGRREPNLRTLVRLAEGLGCTADWLLGRYA